MRHSNDGEPFYCEFCGAGYAEFMACEDMNCKLEDEKRAQHRRENWLNSMNQRQTKSEVKK